MAFKRIDKPGTAARRKHELFMGQVRVFRAAHKAELDKRIARALQGKTK